LPAAVIDIAIETRSSADAQRLTSVLDQLVGTEPALSFIIDLESGQCILSGDSEERLADAVAWLRDAGMTVNFGAPQAACREVITRTVEHDYVHKRAGEFARIKFRIEPNEAGVGFEFVSAVVGGNVPEEYVLGVNKGVASVMNAGPIIGFPIVDLKFTLLDGAYHEVDSSAVAFDIAGRAGFREAVVKAAPRIIEPIMRIEIVAPEDCVAEVIGDLHARRGQLRATKDLGDAQFLGAMVPVKEMFGYANALRAMSQGRAQYSMTFDHFEQIPTAPNPFDPDDRFRPAMAMRA
jgi:elongation factor G